MTRQWPAFWSRTGGLATLLLPLEWLFRQAAAWRRRRLQRNPPFIAAPVVVVGNLIVGGSGKTPLVIWLVDRAAARGWRPGVVMRGYGGHVKGIERVGPETDPERVGDEAVLIARRTGVPVMVGRDRPAAARALVSGEGVDLVISDDGLQHYRLVRDAEVAVVDVRRGQGNGHCLPAGPLREPLSRLREVDCVIGRGGAAGPHGDRFDLLADPLEPLGETAGVAPVAGDRVHAVAGIGEPERFFESLRESGLEVIPHAFGDHHHYRAGDLPDSRGYPLVVTQKDAVKLSGLAPAGSWQLPVSARPDAASAERLEGLLEIARRRFEQRRRTP